MTHPARQQQTVAATYILANAQLNELYRMAIQGDGRKRSAVERRAWLQRLLASALAILAALAIAAEEYATGEVGTAFASGALSFDPQWEWNDAAIKVANELAADSYADLIAANDTVRTSVKRLFSDLTRAAQSSSLSERIASLMEAEQQSAFGVARVLYANGARFPLDAYVQMAVRTKLAVAYSSGVIHTAHTAGVEFFEVSDGAECGWTSHDDPDTADGSIRTVDDFWQNPIAHPNCVRLPVPRPDLTTAQEAASATPVATFADLGEPQPAPAEPVVAGRSPSWARGVTTAAAAGGATSAISQRRAARQFARRRRTQR